MKEKILTSHELYNFYIIEKLSLRDVAKRLNCSSGTVRKYMKKYNIPRRTKNEALSGEKNPMYGKAHSFESRLKIINKLKITNALPEIHKKRSEACSGEKNGMYGKTQSDEVNKKSSERLKELWKQEWFVQKCKEKNRSPEARKRFSDLAKTRIGNKNSFFGKHHTEDAKAKISKKNTGRFLGKNGSNWQGGKTKLNILIRNSQEYIKWRKIVFERDNYICQNCGKKGGHLHVDHIVPFALIIKKNNITSLMQAKNCLELWDENNGRTLCIDCHKKTLSYAGRCKNFKLEENNMVKICQT